MIPVAEYAPDQPTLGTTSAYIENVIPVTENSYGPIKELTAAGGNELVDLARGAASFRGQKGGVITCAGDVSRLYRRDDSLWIDISRTTGPYNAAFATGWNFAQFGDYIVAVNGFDEPQYYDINFGGQFSSLPGSPPIARFATTVRDFLFLANLDAAENKIRWSAINDIKSWDIGINQADEQEFPEGGSIMGVVGGQHALIFQETAIQRGTYVGPDLIFQFDTISRERGCAAPGSIASYREITFFLAPDGFFLLNGAEGEQAIGDQKIDRWFWNNVNEAYLYRITATIDPKAKLYLVAFPSVASVDGTPDTILVYNWTIGRWSRIAQKVDLFFTMISTLKMTLEDLDDINPNLDEFPYSLDNPLLIGSPIKSIAGFIGQKLGFFTGNTMPAIVDTAEGELNPGVRSLVRFIRPLVEGGNASVSLGTRNRLSDPVIWGSDISQLENGECPVRVHARYHRARLKIPAGSLWSHVLGIDADVIEAGGR